MNSYEPYKYPYGVLGSDPHEIFIKNENGVYTEEFKEYLYRLQNQILPTVRPIPSDANLLPVKLSTREIEIKDTVYEEFLSIETDHRSETVYFSIDRFYNDIDLMECSCIIEYINAGDQARIYPVTLRDLRKVDNPETGFSENKMIIAWNLGNEATAYDGLIKFAITFFRVSYEVNPNTQLPYNFQILYALHTLPQVGRIHKGMGYYTEQKKELLNYYTLNDQHFIALMGMINQKNVYWNDL